MHYACKEEKHYQNSYLLFRIYHHHVQTFLFHEEEDTISLKPAQENFNASNPRPNEQHGTKRF